MGYARGISIGLASVMAVATPMVAQFEGLRTKAYLDAAGIPTICYGETEGVAMGQARTAQECDDMLNIRLAWYAMRVGFLVDVPMTPERHAALASFAYNVGVDAFRNSTLRRRVNAQDPGACQELDRWVCVSTRPGSGDVAGQCRTSKLDKRKLRGLETRRQKEKELCLR